MTTQLSAMSRQISNEFSTMKYKINTMEKKLDTLERKIDLILVVLNRIEIKSPLKGVHVRDNIRIDQSSLPPPPAPL